MSRSSCFGELADRLLGRVAVQLDAAAERRLGREVAEHEVRVGDGRLGAAPPVARGTRIGARRARADPSAPPPSRQAIEPPPAPTVWTASIGSASGRPAISPLLRSWTLPRSTTHTSHEVPPMSRHSASCAPACARDERGARGASRRARQHSPRRVAGGGLDVDQASVGLHDRRLGQAGFVYALGEPAEIAGQQRRQRGVDLGGRGALELAERAHDLVRERDVGIGQGLGQRLADRLLVLGVAVRVEQRDRDRLGFGLGDLIGELGCRLAVSSVSGPSGVMRSGAPKRRSRGASGAGRAAHSRYSCGAILAAERDEVGEPLGRDERGPRAVTLEQRVGRDRHPVGELARRRRRLRPPCQARPRSRPSRPLIGPQAWSAPWR